jgi:hypothetical protein
MQPRTILQTIQERPRARTNSRRIVLHPQPETTRAFGTRRATRRITAKHRRASAVPPTVHRIAPTTTQTRPRVRTIVHRGLVRAPQPTPEAVALTRRPQGARLPTIAAIRLRHHLTLTPRQRLAVPIPPLRAPTQHLAAAMAGEVAEAEPLAGEVAEPRTEAVVVAVTPIVRSLAFRERPASIKGGGPFDFSAVPGSFWAKQQTHNSHRSCVLHN